MLTNTIENIRNQFPFLTNKVSGKELIYFDSAATSQRPQSVISAINEWNSFANANVHRAVHHLSACATDNYESGREAIRKFVNASKREEIIFTSGTTASINLLANTIGGVLLKEGEAVLITEAEHHSNIVPWQILTQRIGAKLIYLPVDESGQWDMEQLDTLFESENIKFVSAAHISNVLGLVNPIERLIQTAHKYGAKVHIDGAQGIVHQEVDVKKIDCDFYSFSGHKIYAATGIGVLYGKESLLDILPPWMAGGDMVDTVTFYKTTYAKLPLKFEAGTPNFIGGATFTPALEFARSVRCHQVEQNERMMKDFLIKELTSIEGLEIYGMGENKSPVYSFSIDGIHHSDIAMLLDQMGIAVRSGLMCAEPLINKFGKTGLVRVSLAPYNTLQECEIFIDALNRAIRMLR
ncbi:MAG: SufS family cysteine desulfurase [Bacteroidales bacterium]|nr:SufS family cysteine desulfurase [Bacteroidales bacterium]